MKVSDLMTSKPATCHKNASLQDVAKMMVEHDCGMIPIVESNGQTHVIGTVTDRDICIRAVAEGRNPLEMTAGDVMSSNPITIAQSASDEEAEELMEKHQIRRLVVVDDNGNCCGVLAQADIARHESKRDTGRLVREISKPSQPMRSH